jgi:hypothetical protein
MNDLGIIKSNLLVPCGKDQFELYEVEYDFSQNVKNIDMILSNVKRTPTGKIFRELLENEDVTGRETLVYYTHDGFKRKYLVRV